MAYQFIITQKAQKQISHLPRTIRLKIVEKITALAENPRPEGYLKLKGTQNQYRIRIGDYRVRYEILDQRLIVLVIAVAHRKDIYRGD
jgi:mRNA interferase RelE/StbE